MTLPPDDADEMPRPETWASLCGDADDADETDCNILGLGVTKREETDVCTAFMHIKSGEFLRFHLKPSK
jgi:hypothetical protein